MIDDLYQEILLEEYAHPKNMGELDNPDVTVSETNASCGDQFTVFLKFDPKTHQLTQVSWTGAGCAISMAMASILSENLKGKTRQEVTALTEKNLESMIGVRRIAYGRQKCLTLALHAFQKAVVQESEQRQVSNEQ